MPIVPEFRCRRALAVLDFLFGADVLLTAGCADLGDKFSRAANIGHQLAEHVAHFRRGSIECRSNNRRRSSGAP